MRRDVLLRELGTVGYVRLPGAVAPAVVAAMCAGTWEALGAEGIVEGDRSTWSATRDRSWVAVQPVRHRAGDEGPEDSTSVRAALDAVLGPRRTRTRTWGKALVALPTGSPAWSVPGTGWHFDHPYVAPGMVTAVNLFLLIDDVVADGGGTAVVRNSPVIMDRLLAGGARFAKVSEQNRAFVAATTWTRGLSAPAALRTAERTSRYLEDTLVDGVPLRVEELCGDAGDVFVCHPALFHTISPNTSDRPRLMRVQRIHATS